MQVCLERPDSYNTKASLHFPPKAVWFAHIVRYGLSACHMRPRTMEGVMKASRFDLFIFFLFF